jgi:peptidoglycan/LPS O-acetylase OafA/YrhL
MVTSVSTIHYFNTLQNSGFTSLWFYFSFRRRGVELFFTISGFMILMTLEHTKSGLDFVVSRFSR